MTPRRTTAHPDAEGTHRPLFEHALREAGRGLTPLLLDGGLGTELLSAARESRVDGRPLELLNSSHPELVLDAHARFLAAGSQVITTNTFCAQRTLLEAHGLGERTAELNTLGATLARQAACAASTASRPRWVLGSIGPGTYGSDPSPLDEGRVHTDYLEQARALVAAGVDGLLIETATRVRVAVIAADAASEATLEAAAGTREPDASGPSILVSFHVDGAGQVADGDLGAALSALAGRRVALVGLNCASGPESLEGPLRELFRAGVLRTGSPGPASPPALGVWPNAGTPIESSMHPVSPQAFAAWIAPHLEEPQLALVGGCCGASPAHIAELASLLESHAQRP